MDEVIASFRNIRIEPKIIIRVTSDKTENEVEDLKDYLDDNEWDFEIKKENV